jgi:hypothetical protein
VRFFRLLTALVSAFSDTGTAFAEARRDFDLSNKTGYEIKEVCVSPSKSDDWQHDVLGTGTLPSGNKVPIKFSRAAQTCEWDVKVV